MLAVHPLIGRPSHNWAGVSGKGNRFNHKIIKRKNGKQR
jgi:hypothetical protein